MPDLVAKTTFANVTGGRSSVEPSSAEISKHVRYIPRRTAFLPSRWTEIASIAKDRLPEAITTFVALDLMLSRRSACGRGS